MWVLLLFLVRRRANALPLLTFFGIVLPLFLRVILLGMLVLRVVLTCPPLPSNIVAETDSVRFCRFAFI